MTGALVADMSKIAQELLCLVNTESGVRITQTITHPSGDWLGFFIPRADKPSVDMAGSFRNSQLSSTLCQNKLCVLLTCAGFTVSGKAQSANRNKLLK